ncbi:hypothetical protein [Chitinibacter tainanensis]|uniref:hypothetical protein n=1 Tax=Chitinibacter tainanensis TaxID=230667 RepID=UPI0023531D2E|nr:hypothetical protein [Chitinibacter tainanensis]
MFSHLLSRPLAGLLSVCWLSLAAHAEPLKLRIALDSAWAPPQVVLDNGEPVGGLYYELLLQIARNVNATPEWLQLPRKRLPQALEQGLIDLWCHTNPSWQERSYPPERWSSLFLRQENVIIHAPQHGHAPFKLDQGEHRSIGTVLGFRYPLLEPYFQRGQYRRIDAPSQQALLRFTQSGQLHLSVVNRLIVDEFNHQQAPQLRVPIVQTLDIRDTYCLLSSNPQVPAEQLKQAIRQLATQAPPIVLRYGAPN